jgi:hypothetical protein
MRSALYTGVSALAVAGAGSLTIGLATPAAAGNIVLTGHDNDYHCYFGDGNACNALGAEASYVRNGSLLPVLVIDNGAELAGSLTGLGVANIVVTPGAVTAGMFNHSVYSAFAVASVTSCGGCDNPYGTGAGLAGYETAIASFFNAGGGILGLSGATDPNAYNYVPESGGNTTAIYSFSGFVATPAASAIPGFVAVNGDETHNTFSDFSSFFQVAETYGDGGPAVTLFGSGGTIGCTGTHCVITGGGAPEPSTWAMLGLGVFGLGYAMRRRRRNSALSAAA